MKFTKVQTVKKTCIHNKLLSLLTANFSPFKCLRVKDRLYECEQTLVESFSYDIYYTLNTKI